MDETKDVAATHFQAASEWEASRLLSAEKSERRAWLVAGVMGVGLLTSLGAIMLMAPLKENTPYVVRVDNATGVPDIVTAMADQVVSGDDVMSKYWMAKYIRHRETYDWHTLQTDYDTVGLMSSVSVGDEYADLFTGSQALHEEYGDRVKATIKIVSVVPTGEGTGTVRFIKTTARTKGGGVEDVTRWVATIAFTYRNTAPARESVRLINPFGFRVTSYRVDPEIIGDE